ncbi:MAG: HD-GYP domain-containing protein, partial [Candidatus Omnitrophota bacterium]
YFGSVDYLATYGVSVYPFGYFPVISCVLILAYAIVNYRLMDIEVIIRETAVFAGIFGFAVGTFVVVMHVGQTLLEPYIRESHPLLFPAVALFLVTIAVRPIEKLTYNTIGKLLFKKRQKYQKALKDAAVGMATIRKPDRLLGLITYILSKSLRPTNAAVYIFDDEEKSYSLRAARYPSKIDQKIEFSSEEAIVTWLKENRQPIVLEEIEHFLREEQLRPHKEVLASDLEQIKRRLLSLNATVCIPSFYHEDELLGILVLGDKKSGDLYTQDDLELLNSLADEAAFAIRNSMLYRKLQKKADEISKIYGKEQTMFAHAATAFANAIDARDPYTHGHSQRVTGYCLALADQMEEARFGGKERYKWLKQRLRLAALLHDIGKVAIPDNILQKKGKLNAEEYKKMKEHPVIGAKVLGYVRGFWDIVSAVRHHHERYDGGGYPDGLKAESIPFMSRVMAVADTFDAMTSNRPYRKTMTAEVTKQEINNNSTIQFDPYVVGAFMKAYAKNLIKKIMGQNR